MGAAPPQLGAPLDEHPGELLPDVAESQEDDAVAHGGDLATQEPGMGAAGLRIPDALGASAVPREAEASPRHRKPFEHFGTTMLLST